MDGTRHLKELQKHIAKLENSSRGLARNVAEKHPERSKLALQAEWHLRGLLYHLKRCVAHHELFTQDVAARISTGATSLMMSSDGVQPLLFEFYALVNLCKISLDNLRLYLSPFFLPSSPQLPKSITDVAKRGTNCPIYQGIFREQIFGYLVDLRNCLVHYRSFATSDNVLVIEQDGVNPFADLETGAYFDAMARADYRRIGEGGIAVHILLPDKVFERTANDKRLASFTYENRWNLLAIARDFTEFVIEYLTYALRYLADVEEPRYMFGNARDS